MAYTTVDNPELYFQTKLYTGTGSSNAVTLDGSEDMQPDWVWIKRRTAADHKFTDSVRGTTKVLECNSTAAESTDSNGLTAFNSDGFTVGSSASFNSNTVGFASWNWKAGTSFTNDASSTGIGSIDSAGSVSDTAGFSICSFTGTGSNGTIKHGLSTKPNVILMKKRASGTANWNMQHSGINTDYQTDYIYLDTNAGSADEDTKWNDTAPTTSVFSVGSDGATNNSGDTYISYIFSNRQGYSKFGSYTGNGNADGTFVYTGFKPAWVLVKNTGDSANWMLFDNKRDTDNVVREFLEPNTSDADNSNPFLDFLSNGFKLKDSNADVNANSYVYIFLAFAESPLTNSKGVPNNAR